MQPVMTHEWPETAEKAITLQHQLRDRLILTDQIEQPVRHVAGVDVGFEEGGTITRAAIAILSFPELQLQESAIARCPTTFPYIPGLLSFREIPAVLEALSAITVRPEIWLCDGMGIAHPRRLGIASHLGLLIDMPTIGVGKSRLVGTYAEVPDEKGQWQPLMHKGDRIGAVLRNRQGTQPLFISPGHRISLETSLKYVLRCTTKYRLPETTRCAHKLASENRG